MKLDKEWHDIDRALTRFMVWTIIVLIAITVICQLGIALGRIAP